MTESLMQTLKSLRDVDGIVGSFVVNADGRLLARDLPTYFDDNVLDEVGPRLHRLYEAWQSNGDTLEAATLVFAEHKLYLRELSGGALGVLSSLQVNAPALKMALSLVTRKLAGEIGTLMPLTAAKEAAPAPTVAPPAAPTATDSSSRTTAKIMSPRMYRGQRIPG
jgi:predicted regulator of Ras-like GTPase activity (Roadblock/LC7/MglB family)